MTDDALAMQLLQTLGLSTWNDETQTDDVDSSQVTEVLAAFDAARAAEQAKPEIRDKWLDGYPSPPGLAEPAPSAAEQPTPWPTFNRPPVEWRELDEVARYVGIAPERVRALFGVLAMVSTPAKPEPQQPSTRELIAMVRAAFGPNYILLAEAVAALTELEKRLGGV